MSDVRRPLRLRDFLGWFAIGTVAMVAALSVVGWHRWIGHSARAEHKRYVSLSPAITETLVALGVDAELVGVSDYCHFPAQVERIAHVGSGFTPRYEAIVGLLPTTVFVEAVNAVNVASLARVVRVEAMPWLTLGQVIESTRRLGRMTGHADLAERLAKDYAQKLQPHLSAASPRVLLVMAHSPGEIQEIVFIRRNSIHGRVLEAAGARNAVDEDVGGAPRLSLEQVIRCNPDGIVILQSASRVDERLLDDWRKLGVLRAVQTNQIKVIAAPEVAIPGPRLVDLVQQIASVVGPWNKAA